MVMTSVATISTITTTTTAAATTAATTTTATTTRTSIPTTAMSSVLATVTPTIAATMMSLITAAPTAATTITTTTWTTAGTAIRIVFRYIHTWRRRIATTISSWSHISFSLFTSVSPSSNESRNTHLPSLRETTIEHRLRRGHQMHEVTITTTRALTFFMLTASTDKKNEG